MAFFVTDKSAGPSSDPVPVSYVDILYDHAGYLRSNDARLGSGDLRTSSIGIIGAGPAGLCAAYLLMRMGANVTIYEKDPKRAGGRIYSYKPVAGDPAIFELGAMRVPPSERVFNYFASQFGMKPGGQFPDPGKVLTQIIFQNQVYSWPAGGSPPGIFANVSKGWGNLVKTFQPIIDALGNASTFNIAEKEWQKRVYSATGLKPEQGYSTISFYQALVQAFVENHAKYGLAHPWTEQEFALFGALGLGSGGFGPLYQVNFAEIVRLVVNGLETNQQFYPGGLSALIDGFLKTTPGGGASLNSRIRYGTPATALLPTADNVRLQYGGTAPGMTTHDAVIVATTTRAMEVEMLLPNCPLGPVLHDKTQSTAIQELHLMSSSKLFVLTKNKFWLERNSKFPSNIQTDELVRGLYCLDYGDQTKYGVVLVSYTWGDDSVKYMAIKNPQQRLNALLLSLTSVVPDFAFRLGKEAISTSATVIDWQAELGFYGAFKLNYPGQDSLNQSLYYQFLKSDNRLYLAGDSVGWCGGWIEGALQTGVNAAAAVVQRCGGRLYANSPMTQKSSRYNYGP